MSRCGGPKLPKELLDRVGDGRVVKRNHQQTRKDRRKQERTQKKHVRPHPKSRDDALLAARKAIKPPNRRVEPPEPRPVPERRVEKEPEASESESEGEDADEDEGEDEEDYPQASVVSKAVKAKLDDDDDEIARLEKKLGIKKGRKKVGDDELDWLVGGGGSSDDDDDDSRPPKRNRDAPEDNEWLRQKRQKASKWTAERGRDRRDDEDQGNSASSDEEGYASEELVNPFSDDEQSEGDFEGFEDEEVPQPRKRENPYIAPVTSTAPAGKYVPPSLRKAASNDDEILKQLRRQMQGQLNRLSESNILSILAAIQEIYQRNARQHCTSVLVELLQERVCDPSDPGDNALILFAAFATAVYRVIGTDFAAQLLENLVHAFDHHQQQGSEGKQSINILSFLSNLYVLQTIGCEIIFEYIKTLLNNFSENNTVLLLRIIRISGPQLRQDDPTALKDIVLLLQRSVAAAGGVEKVSQRTRVMIDFIHDLKNNRVKTNRGPDATAQDHMQRIKKTLGTVKNQKTTEALRIGLADIRDSEKKGKWWLVGASWRDPAKMISDSSTLAENTTPTQSSITTGVQEDVEDSDAEVDLNALARAQGMNTDVRRAIFVSIAGAVDPQHAHIRLIKLNLKNKQMLEIPRVVLHCVGAEPIYNHFYTLVGTKFCSDHRMRKAWQFALLDVLRRCGEDTEADEESAGDELSVRQIYNIAKTYATLISEGLLRISVLKPLRFAALQPKNRIFAEVLLTTLFILLRKKNGKEKYGKAVEEVFGDAHFIPDMVKGLAYFVESVMPNSDAPANKKEKKVVLEGCEYASVALRDETKLVKSTGDPGDDNSDVDGSIEVSWN